jgi:ribosomal protein L17
LGGGGADESRTSATSWGAIAAGGVGAAAFSIFLHELGVGVGLSFLNPWDSAPSGTTITAVAGISLCLISIMASALGGFLAGRLRTRWVGLHTDETYFRDTAHGFLAWAFALILMAIAIGFGATTLLGGAVHGAASGAASNPSLTGDTSYYTDMLFRSDNPTTPPASPGAQNSNDEVGRIVSRSVTSSGGLSAADRTYVAQRVAQRTGLPQDQAQQRVDQVITQAKQAADDARRAAAKLAFWMAGAMLCGAVAAAFAAAEGGRERDD